MQRLGKIQLQLKLQPHSYNLTSTRRQYETNIRYKSGQLNDILLHFAFAFMQRYSGSMTSGRIIHFCDNYLKTELNQSTQKSDMKTQNPFCRVDHSWRPSILIFERMAARRDKNEVEWGKPFLIFFLPPFYFDVTKSLSHLFLLLICVRHNFLFSVHFFVLKLHIVLIHL